MHTLDERKDNAEYAPDPLGRLEQGQWVIKQRSPQPWADEQESDPEVAQLRQQWRTGLPFTGVYNEDGSLRLIDAVGRGQPNQRGDVARLEIALRDAKQYEIDSTEGPTGWFGAPQEAAMRKYQREAGLRVDGQALAGGPTAKSLLRPDRFSTGLGEIEASRGRALKEAIEKFGPLLFHVWREATKPRKEAGDHHIEPAPPMPPLPPSLPDPPKKPEVAEAPSTNAVSPILPGHIPSDTKPEDWIEILVPPDFKIPLLVDNRKGGPRTIERNNSIAGALIEAGGADRFEHTHGGNKPELKFPEKAGAGGASFPDGIIRSKKTGRRLLWNDAGVLADGVTPNSDERKQIFKIMINKETGDIFVVSSKPKDGEEFDYEEVKRLALPLLEEIDKEYTGGGDTVHRWTTVIRKLSPK